jgi:hypothetical protein
LQLTVVLVVLVEADQEPEAVQHDLTDGIHDICEPAFVNGLAFGTRIGNGQLVEPGAKVIGDSVGHIQNRVRVQLAAFVVLPVCEEYRVDFQVEFRLEDSPVFREHFNEELDKGLRRSVAVDYHRVEVIVEQVDVLE